MLTRAAKGSPLTNDEVDANFASKQEVLVSGENIKTLNGKSVLGSGDLVFVGGLIPTAVKTANYTASVNDLVRVDSASGVFTITLPASPVDGDKVGLLDITNKCGINAVLIAPTSGKTVEGDIGGLSIDISGASVSLIYLSTSSNWKLLSTR
jgi:hypothetical protein